MGEIQPKKCEGRSANQGSTGSDVELVKGSHLRWDSPAEYHVRRADGGGNSTELMPGSTRIALEPGDCVCFNSWGYHRGRYHVDKPRRTLMFT